MARSNGSASALLFVTALAGGLLLTVAGLLWSGAADGPARRLRSASAEVTDGSVTAVVDSVIEERHPLRDAALAVLAAGRYVLFGEALGEAVVGREGMLFTLEEFERHPHDERVLAERLDEIVRIRDALRAREIALVVAILPSKARVLSADLSARWAELADHHRYDEALQRLRLGSVHVVGAAESLATPGGQRRFFARDTHWTPQGSAAVAGQIAATAEEAGLLQGIDRVAYQRVSDGTAPVPGDLMRFLPVGRWRRVLGLPEETAEVYRASQPEGAGALGLFDELSIPVALVGTSFSRDPRWGFEAALKVALEADVLNVAEEGEGPFEPMRAYLSGETISEVPPRLVVWEIPERYLTLAQDDVRASL